MKSVITLRSDYISGNKLMNYKRLGADYAINYTSEKDWAQHILDITNKKGVDIILDSIGASYYESVITMI